MIIGFSKNNGILSRLVRWATRSKVSHAYIIFDVAGESVVLHSTRRGINFDLLSDFVSYNEPVADYILMIDSDTEQRGVQSSIKLLDSPYDFLSLAGFAWVLACRAVGFEVRAPFKNRAAYHCSEFALTVLQNVDIDFPNADPELTSPESLMSLLDSCKKALRA